MQSLVSSTTSTKPRCDGGFKGSPIAAGHYLPQLGHRSNRTEAWSTGASTSTSTEIRPVD